MFPISSSFLLGHLPYFWKKDEVCGRVLQDVFLDWWVLTWYLLLLPQPPPLMGQLAHTPNGSPPQPRPFSPPPHSSSSR